ncbi:hypothetical protein MOQ72_41315 [Saccharopolyspora sp. K220]|uniref:hypothetical protein n=1 Tax=Saccharopolyspora soli TaxID=2926618 RepID=UPI001F5AA331|nr:hypothetical protein [Saccharopolyspora soli]MCI2423862.1 hypothetical protein [Saccharopolyspora soli]
MILWDITNYNTALQTELRIRHATKILRAHFGRRWKSKVPAEVSWLLGRPIPLMIGRCQQALGDRNATRAAYVRSPIRGGYRRSRG